MTIISPLYILNEAATRSSFALERILTSQQPTFEKQLRAAKQGDEDAAEYVLRDVQTELMAFAEYLTRSDPDFEASDLLQTVLQEAWTKIASCNATKREQFTNWLESIADSRHKDALRMMNAKKRGGDAHHVEPSKDAEGGMLFLIDEVTNGQTGPATGLQKRDLIDVVRAAVASLPENYRIATELYYYEDASGSDVASRLDITEPNAFVRLSRAREMIRERLNSMLGSSTLR